MQQFLFTEGLDKDNDVRFVKSTKLRNANNARITAVDGDKYLLTNIKGNVLVPLDENLPPNLYRVIGSYDDKTNQKMYVFVYSPKINSKLIEEDKGGVVTFTTEGVKTDHILEHNYADGTVKILVKGDLQFDVKKKITGIEVVENRYLAWTNRVGEPNILDLTKPSRIPSDVTNLNRYIIEAAKIPLQTKIVADYTTDTSIKNNGLNGRAWQFSVIFTYKDLGKSVLSSYSNVPVPSSNSIQYFGAQVPTTTDNAIEVTFNIPNQDIEIVELCVRSKILDEAPSQFFVCKSWKGEEVAGLGSNTTFSFTNNEFERFVDNNEILQIANFFPKVSQSLTLGYGNRLFYANNEDGFDIDFPTDTRLSFNYNSRPSFVFQNTLTFSIFPPAVYQQPTANIAAKPFMTVVGRLPSEGNYQYASLQGNSKGNRLTTIKVNPQMTYTNDNTNVISGNIGVIQNISVQKVQTSGNVVIGQRFDVELKINNVKFVTGIPEQQLVQTIEGTVAATSNIITDLLSKVVQLINDKAGAVGDYGGVVAVRDGNDILVFSGISTKENPADLSVMFSSINSFTITANNDNIIGNIPPTPSFKRQARQEMGMVYFDSKGRASSVVAKAEETPIDFSEGGGIVSAGKVDANYRITHLAPTWATHYALVHRSVKQNYIYFIAEVTEDGANEYTALLKGFINYTSQYSDMELAYTYEKGDTIELIQDTENNNFVPLSTEATIIKYDNTNNTLKFKQNSDQIPTKTYLIRIKKLTTTELTTPFNEIGHIYPIINRRHVSNTGVQPLGGFINVRVEDYGDCYFRPRLFVDVEVADNKEVNYNAWVEDAKWSDFSPVEATGKGRPNVIDPTFKERKRTTGIVFTEPFITDSFVNGLSTVYDQSIQVYNSQYGDIERIKSDGRVLEVYMETKVGAVGIQQANALMSAGGVNYDTSRVLNEMEYYAGEYGIGNEPESFSDYANNKYFVDKFRGCILRKATNGIFPISDYDMVSEFNKLLRNTIRPISHIRTTFDRNNKELLVNIGYDVFLTKDDVTIDPFPREGSVFNLETPYPTKLTVGTKVKVLYRIEILDQLPPQNTVILTTGTVVFNQFNSLSINVEDTLPFAAQFEAVSFEDRIVYSFSEPLNAWISRRDNKGEWLEERNIKLSSFKDGKIYLEEESETRNNFYDEQFGSEITLICNEQPNFPKRFKSIQELGNSLMLMPKMITNTPSGVDRTLFQETNLLPANFKRISNMWVSGFWKDINSVNVNNPRFNGNDMRGQYAEITLTNDNTTALQMWGIGVNYILTDISNSQ